MITAPRKPRVIFAAGQLNMFSRLSSKSRGFPLQSYRA